MASASAKRRQKWQRQRGKGSRQWWRKKAWRLSGKQWRNGDCTAGFPEGTVKGGSGDLEWSESGGTFEKKKKGFVMINSDRCDILRKANSFSLIASLQHLTQHLQRNSLSAVCVCSGSFYHSGLYNKSSMPSLSVTPRVTSSKRVWKALLIAP